MVRTILLASTRICFAPDGAGGAPGGDGGGAASGGAAANPAPGAGAAVAPGAQAGAAAGAGGAAPGGAALDWTSTLEEDDRTFISTKGYKTPGDLIKAYHNAERVIGLDKVALPKPDSAPEVWDEYFRKIGRPDKPDGYQFKAPEGIEGYDGKLAGWFGGLSHEAGLTPKQASLIHDKFMEMVKTGTGASAQQVEQQHETNYATLRKEWGAAATAKIEAANRAIRYFGGDEMINLLKSAGLNSHPALNRAFAKIGEAMEDDKVGATGNGGGGFAMTPADATAEIKKMEGDDKGPLYDRFHPEHELAVKRRSDLYKMAHPNQK